MTGADSGSSLYDFLTPVLLSLRINLIASAGVFLLGALIAWPLARKRFRGRTLVETIFMLPLVLPPTVVGFILLVLLGRRSLFGRFAEWVLRHPFVFTWQAAALASFVVAFPLVYQTMKTGFLSVDQQLIDAARSGGAGEWQVFRWIVLPLSRRHLVTAYLLGFARGLGEFGATIMVAGNIPGKTQTVPTAIYTAVDAGHMTLAWLWVGAVIVISVLLLFVANRGPRRGNDTGD